MIYIIDDDKYVLRGFQILLLSAGMETTVFTNAEEFIDKWTPDENDTLILDIHMPGLNGCDVIKYLGETGLHLPVIVITAYDENETRQLASDYGVLAYLTKPVDGEVLINLLTNKKTKKINLND